MRVIFFSVLWLLFGAIRSYAEEIVVTPPSGTRGYLLETGTAEGYVDLPVGTVLEKISALTNSSLLHVIDQDGRELIVPLVHTADCSGSSLPRWRVRFIQNCLMLEGYDPNGVDGIIGAGTINALGDFLTNLNVRPLPTSLSCKLSI